MCVGCHLAPGVEQTELSQALYPAPPNSPRSALTQALHPPSGSLSMESKQQACRPGKSMGDEYIWGMVAFISQLPKIDATQYQALVAASGGHQHGGGESQTHNHESLMAAILTIMAMLPLEESLTSRYSGCRPPRRLSPEADHHSSSSNGDDHHGGSNSSTKGSSASDHHGEPASNAHTHADGKEHVHDS